MSQEERRIAEIEAEMARTQKNKGTEKHLGRLRGELAALRSRVAARSAGQRKTRRPKAAVGEARVVRRDAGSVSDVRAAMEACESGLEPVLEGGEGDEADNAGEAGEADRTASAPHLPPRPAQGRLAVGQRRDSSGGGGSAAVPLDPLALQRLEERVLCLFSESHEAKVELMHALPPPEGGQFSDDAACFGSALLRVLTADNTFILFFEGDDIRIWILKLLACAPKPDVEAGAGLPPIGTTGGSAGSPEPVEGKSFGPTPTQVSPLLLCVLQALKLDYCSEVQQRAVALLSSWLDHLTVHERRRLLVRRVVPALARTLRLFFSPYSIPPFLRTGNQACPDTTLSLARAMILRSCAPFLALESGTMRAPETSILKSALLELYRATLGGKAADGYCDVREILDLRGCLEHTLAIALLDKDQTTEVAAIRAELDRREDLQLEIEECKTGERGSEGHRT